MFRDRDIWRVRYKDPATGKRTSKSFATKNEAARFELDLKDGLTTTLSREEQDMTFRDYAERWFRDYAQVEKSETTWRNDRTAIERHINPVLGDLKLLEIRKSHGLHLKGELSRKELTPKTVNNILSLAKKILSTATDYALLQVNPFQQVKLLKNPKPKFRYWSPEESEKFLKRCKELDPELWELCLVALQTGMRLGELRALTRKELDFGSGMIQVAATFSRPLRKRLERSKNGEVGYVPMNSEVLEVLKSRKMMAPDQPVFREHLTQNARDKLIAMCKRAGVQVLTFHDLRHTFASQLALAGTDFYRIQKLMRHKSLAMTQRYAHLHPDDLKGSTEVLTSAKRPQESKIPSSNLG